MKRWLKEPLFHFLVLGGLIFAVHAWLAARRPPADAAAHIEVTAATIAWLRESFSRQWHRPPDETQLRALVASHLREEVLYREAVALGLDRDDAIVRRRMAQKMEFLSQDVAAAVEPDEAALRAYFAANGPRYAKSEQMSFQHAFFSRERRGVRLGADVRSALRTLLEGGDADHVGDPFLREQEFTKADEADIIAAFGSEFAARLPQLPIGAWDGPVESTYGMHLVRVSERVPAPPVAFEAVRHAVLRDVIEDRRIAANQDLIERLQARYRITIDEAAISGAGAQQATAPAVATQAIAP